MWPRRLRSPNLGARDERDTVIFHDNDFEIFIDPDGDTHAYYELEVNALGTPWDLMLIKPYRDGGPAINGWDIAGLRVGIDLRGTINRPGDRDDGWSVEIAMPWKILKEAAPATSCRRRAIEACQLLTRRWEVDPADGRYAKRLKPGTKDPLPENNGCGVHKAPSTCTCPNAGAMFQFSGKPAGSGTDAFC